MNYTITSEQLQRGLRPSKRTPRNTNYLYECSGAVGREGTLQVLDKLYPLYSGVIDDGFPYPQIFILMTLIIVCGETKIYEYANDKITEKIATPAGNLWSVADFHDYIYLTNNVVSITRDPGTQEYSTLTSGPVANAAFNYNGQAIIGGLTGE